MSRVKKKYLTNKTKRSQMLWLGGGLLPLRIVMGMIFDLRGFSFLVTRAQVCIIKKIYIYIWNRKKANIQNWNNKTHNIPILTIREEKLVIIMTTKYCDRRPASHEILDIAYNAHIQGTRLEDKFQRTMKTMILNSRNPGEPVKAYMKPYLGFI